MFCNKCGRTVKEGDEVCHKCGAPLGESRFEGSGYTSVQSRHAPSESEGDDSSFTPTFTRTTYTTMDEPEKDDVLTRTTYRPILVDGGASREAPEEEKESEPDDAPEEAPAPEEMPYNVGIEPLKPIVPKGIDPEVEQYIQRIKGRGALPLISKKKRSHDEDEEDEEINLVDLDEDEDDEDDDFASSGDPSKIVRILALVAGAIVIVGLLVFGFMWISSNLVPKSPIEGVTRDVYDKGLELLAAHMESGYRVELVKGFQSYLANPDMEGENTFTRLENDRNEISGLLPEKPQENDQLFIDALLSIQSSISDAISLDYSATLPSDNSDMLKTNADEAWKTITAAIDRIKSATKAEDLNEIAGIAKVDTSVLDQPTTTPTPTQVPYKNLARGEKSDDVKKLQQRLIELNYLTGQADGDFGKDTQTAVKMFQQAVGMAEQNGIASPELQEQLFSDDAPSRAATSSENTAQ